MLTISVVSLLSALTAAFLAPPPRRRVPTWLPGLGAFCAPVLFAAILSLARADHEALSFIAVCAMAVIVGTLMWCLRSPGNRGEDGGGGGGGGGNRPLDPEPSPRGGGLLWDWERFDSDFAVYVSSQRDRDSELVPV